GNMYSAYAEVTNYVKTHGTGDYYVADIALREGNGGNTGYYGGWTLVVVYENSDMNWRDITVFDGHAYMVGGTASEELKVPGVNAVESGDVHVKIGMRAGEGDRNISGDYVQMYQNSVNGNGNARYLAHDGDYSSSKSGKFNNFFNSSIETGGNNRAPNLT